MPKTTNFDLSYAAYLKEIMDSAPEENERTGKTVRSINGAFFSVKPSLFPILALRDIRPLWSCAEVVWFMGGGLSLDFMHRFGLRAWDKFAEKDGTVPSATGHRWRKFLGFDQLETVLKKLLLDKSSRHGVLLSWYPEKDLLDPGPNAPCVDLWHLHLSRNSLHLSVFQRSGDMYFGVPHDILGASLFHRIVASGLGFELGSLDYLVSNAHLYEDQWSAAEEMIFRQEASLKNFGDFLGNHYEPFFGMVRSDLKRAMSMDEELVKELYDSIMASYRPWEPISGPKLVK